MVIEEFRLIPAWAGKTSCSTTSARTCRAHPRVGGENAVNTKAINGQGGSSPRGRGKPRVESDHHLPTRLIPAWAGKTYTQ